MITRELVDFIKKEKASGRASDQIKEVLLKNGWLPADLDEAFQAADIPIVNTGATIPVSSAPYLNNINRPKAETMPRKSHVSKALLFVFLLILFGGSASAYYFRDNIKTWPVVSEFFPAEICAQVVTQAINPKTGELKTFATPCEVPKGWQVREAQSFPEEETPKTNLYVDSPANEKFFVGNWKTAGNDFMYINFIFSADKTFTLKQYYLSDPQEVLAFSGTWKILIRSEIEESFYKLELDFNEVYNRPNTPELIAKYRNWGIEFPTDKQALAEVDVNESGIFSFRWEANLLQKAFNDSSSDETNGISMKVSSKTIKCVEDDFNCMLTAVASCTPARLEESAKGVFPTRAAYEILGKEKELCKYRESTAGAVFIDPEADNPRIQGVDNSQGNNLECSASIPELTIYLKESFKQIQDLRKGVDDFNNYTKTDDFIEKKCTGGFWIT